ncbi:MAG: hypothetical protein KKB34_10350 [Bacteroidetes bacterium]|nr:hypothetical protein [Bacteroidota bacterium]
MKEKQEKPSKPVNNTDNSKDLAAQPDANFKWNFEFADAETKAVKVFVSDTVTDNEAQAFSTALGAAQEFYGERPFVYTQKFTKTAAK